MGNPQDSIDNLTESVQRLRLMAKMLWQVDGLDKVELGTLGIMLNNECDNISLQSAALELQIPEVDHA